MVDLVERAADVVNVRLQHAVENIAVADARVGHDHALLGREACADDLAQILLETGIAVKAELNCKSDDRRFRHADLLAEPRGGQIRRLIIIVKQVICNGFLPFGEGGKQFLDLADQIFSHRHFLLRCFLRVVAAEDRNPSHCSIFFAGSQQKSCKFRAFFLRAALFCRIFIIF